MFVFVVDGSLLEFANETPAFVLALLFERYTTRPAEVGKSTVSDLGGRGWPRPSCIVFVFSHIL